MNVVILVDINKIHSIGFQKEKLNIKLLFGLLYKIAFISSKYPENKAEKYIDFIAI